MLSLHRVSTDALILINTHTPQTQTKINVCQGLPTPPYMYRGLCMASCVTCQVLKLGTGKLKTGYEVLLEIATASEEKCCSKLFERKYLINLKKAECLAYSLSSYLEYNVINNLSSELDTK